jgi:hypothetical protein
VNLQFNPNESVRAFRVGNEYHTILGYLTDHENGNIMYTSVTRNFEESDETFEDICTWRHWYDGTYTFITSLYERTQLTLLDIVCDASRKHGLKERF